MKFFLILVTGILLLSACRHSSKNGKRELLPVLLSDSTQQASCVFLTSDEKGRPVISWCETGKNSHKKFYMAFFDPDSKTFSKRITIPIEQNASLHEEGMPKIAIKGDGTIIAVYETSAPTDKNSYAGFVHYIVSADKGKSWTLPACLHADTTSGKSRSFAIVTRLSNGEIGACWLGESTDRTVSGRPVKFAQTNRENRFTGELTIDPLACPCCRIAMSSSAKGKIFVVFRDILNGAVRDMSVSTSDDNGKTFTPASPFSNDGWVINGCPHNGPSIAAAGDTMYAAWFTGGRRKGVYYCELNKNKIAMNKQLVSNEGRFIQLCLLADGSRALAYSENMQHGDNIYSRIVLNRMAQGKIFEGNIKTGETMASYPVITSFKDKGILAAWKSNEKIYYTVTDDTGIATEIQRPQAKEMPAAIDLSHIKLAGSTDPVCGMPLSLSPADTTLYENRVYGFCSQTCKERFLQHPANYVSALKNK